MRRSALLSTRFFRSSVEIHFQAIPFSHHLLNQLVKERITILSSALLHWEVDSHPSAGRCHQVFQMLIAFALPPFVLSPLSCSPTSEKHQIDVFHWYMPPSGLSALIVLTKGLADKCATNNKKSPALSNRGLMSLLSTTLFYLRLCID